MVQIKTDLGYCEKRELRLEAGTARERERETEARNYTAKKSWRDKDHREADDERRMFERSAWGEANLFVLLRKQGQR